MSQFVWPEASTDTMWENSTGNLVTSPLNIWTKEYTFRGPGIIISETTPASTSEVVTLTGPDDRNTQSWDWKMKAANATTWTDLGTTTVVSTTFPDFVYAYDIQLTTTDAIGTETVHEYRSKVWVGANKISTPLDLSTISDTDTGNYLQTGDIDMTGVTFISKYLRGSYNGGNYKISNLVITGDLLTQAWFGLFAVINPGKSVRNVIIENADILITGANNTDRLRVGAVVGYSGGEVTNCLVYNSSIEGGTHVGAVVGDGYVRNSMSYNNNVKSSNLGSGLTFTGGITGDGGTQRCIAIDNYVYGGSDALGSYTGGISGLGSITTAFCNTYPSGRGKKDILGYEGGGDTSETYYTGSGSYSRYDQLLLTSNAKLASKYINWDISYISQTAETMFKIDNIGSKPDGGDIVNGFPYHRQFENALKGA